MMDYNLYNMESNIILINENKENNGNIDLFQLHQLNQMNNQIQEEEQDINNEIEDEMIELILRLDANNVNDGTAY